MAWRAERGGGKRFLYGFTHGLSGAGPTILRGGGTVKLLGGELGVTT